MYINDTHILIYTLFGIIGFLVGLLTDWLNTKLPEYKKILSKERYNKLKENVAPNYFLIIGNIIIYIALIYAYGINKNVLENITLLKYLIITPFLLSVFKIDFSYQMIPNRVNLALFEIGLVFLCIQGIISVNSAVNMIVGMVIGGGVFLLISIIGGLTSKKDAMGWGDIKLMGALGLLLGATNITLLMILSFFIGAIVSVILLMFKLVKEYIPFGPFIVTACIIIMLVPNDGIMNILLKIFTLGR